jgi:hypothetical protein
MELSTTNIKNERVFTRVVQMGGTIYTRENV